MTKHLRAVYKSGAVARVECTTHANDVCNLYLTDLVVHDRVLRHAANKNPYYEEYEKALSEFRNAFLKLRDWEYQHNPNSELMQRGEYQEAVRLAGDSLNPEGDTPHE